MDPNGKVALITGGARVGRDVAKALAARGCSVAMTWRGSRESAEETVAAVRAQGAQGIAIQADLAASGASASVIEEVKCGLGRLDILIAMASLYERTDLERLDEEAWTRSIETDLASVYRLAIASAPVMKAQGAGRMIAFADWLPASGRPRYKGYLPYYVAKAGVVGLVEALALELAPAILVNAVAPGPILKPHDMSDAAAQEAMRATPLGRWGGPEEIAKAVLFLIETEFVTGETLRVDGGRHLN